MVFSSSAFLFLFLPIALLSTLAGSPRRQNLILVLCSLFFYYYSGGPLLILLIASCLINWALALAIETRRSPLPLIAGLVLNLGVLFYYKYAHFAAEQISLMLGLPQLKWPPVTLPVGISFFTFQGVSYLIDVWRRELKPFRNPLDIILCVSFFPHLIAGPIVRLSHLADQLVQRTRGWSDFATGASRFAWGLGKKVLIADVCGKLADLSFAADPDKLPASAAWLGLLAYTIQIYFDFSGYSDMAIGLARMFGFRFPENFNHPYTAASLTEFWRRWHMSLSQWFRDYLYIPLGGNRRSCLQGYRNLLIVFLVTGIWHGAGWTFVLWGLFHAVLLIVERLTGVAKWPASRWLLPRRICIALLIMISWAIFRAPTPEACLDFLKALSTFSGTRVFPYEMTSLLDLQTMLALGIGSLSFFSSKETTTGLQIEEDTDRSRRWRAAVLLLVYPAAVIQVMASGYSPFLYFQF